VAGAGGVLYSLGGIQRIAYSWSLGLATNNQAEAYALLQGLRLAKQEEITSLSILGDSKGILSHLRKHTIPEDMKLKNIFIRIYQEMESGMDTQIYHVLWHNNQPADMQANKATQKLQGTLCINDLVL
jgi:ribonuclease HI